MRITLKLFGSAREESGAKELSVELADGARVADLRARMEREHPALARLGGRLRVSRNLQFVGDDEPLTDGDEIAFLPPVSGGVGRCTLSERPLDVGEVVGRVAGSDAGGLVTFVGVVRDSSRGRTIRHLEYESYPPMAEQEMERIVGEVAMRWPGARVAVAHRVGHLEVGEIAVVVAAASAHRAQAFEACRFTIDSLKERVPIWKKEVATDGAYWVDDHA